jgi:hypothetical protein
MTTLNSKRFVLRQSLIGKNQIINVTFKNGKTATYNHDKVFEVMKDTLTKLLVTMVNSGSIPLVTSNT